jgi:hypothetical protein
MEQINFVLNDNIQIVFFLILATIAWLFCVYYLFRQLRRKKYGRRHGDRKVARQKSDDSQSKQKATEQGTQTDL